MTARREVATVEDSVHVLYEIEMLCHLTDDIANKVADGALAKQTHAGLAIRNAIVESFGIHTRVLISFLCGEATKPDDVDALSFIPDWQAPTLDEALDLARRTANKRIAHLTSARREPDEMAWPHVEIRKSLTPALLRFVEDVPDELVTEDFKWRGRRALERPLPEIAVASGPTVVVTGCDLPFHTPRPNYAGTATQGFEPVPTQGFPPQA